MRHGKVGFFALATVRNLTMLAVSTKMFQPQQILSSHRTIFWISTSSSLVLKTLLDTKSCSTSGIQLKNIEPPISALRFGSKT